MGKRSAPARYQAAVLAVVSHGTLYWSLLTPRHPLNSRPLKFPSSARLVSCPGWLGYLASSADLAVLKAKNEEEKEREREKKRPATVCQTGSSSERDRAPEAGSLVQCFSASPRMGKGRWAPLLDRLPLLNPDTVRLCSSFTMIQWARPLQYESSSS